MSEITIQQLEADRQRLVQHPVLIEPYPYQQSHEAYKPYTVKQLKEVLKPYEETGSLKWSTSGLRKEQIIQLILLVQRLIYCKVFEQEIRITLPTIHYSWGPAGPEGTLKDNWLEHLYAYGFTTIPVMSVDQGLAFKERVLNYVESLVDAHNGYKPTPFKRNDPSTWKISNYFSSTYHGLLKEHSGHTRYAADLRMIMAPWFAKIWNIEEEMLRMPIDSTCVVPPRGPDTRPWLHCDAPYDPSFEPGYQNCSIQCMLNLSYADPQRGSFLCIPNSHHVFERYCERNPPTYFMKGFGKTNLNDPELRDLPVVKVCARPGVAIIWLSGVVHANEPARCNPKDLARMQQLGLRISQALTAFPYNSEVAKNAYLRARTYMRGESTGHWVYGPAYCVFKHWHREGQPQWVPGPNSEMGPRPEHLEKYRYWFGFHDLDNEEREKIRKDDKRPAWKQQCIIDWESQL